MHFARLLCSGPQIRADFSLTLAIVHEPPFMFSISDPKIFLTYNFKPELIENCIGAFPRAYPDVSHWTSHAASMPPHL